MNGVGYIFQVLFHVSLSILAGAIATATQIKSKYGITFGAQRPGEFDEHPVRPQPIALIGVYEENINHGDLLWRETMNQKMGFDRVAHSYNFCASDVGKTT